MRYTSDYRRHLWSDFGHVLRTIWTPINQVITTDLGKYLWPIEKDPQMISLYLRALVQGPLEGFVRWLAVHHVTCNIWHDLQADGASGDDRSGKLLAAVVDQGSVDAVREVVRYRQTRGGSIVLPPQCFEGAGDWQVSRLECVGRWGGPASTERLRGLLY